MEHVLITDNPKTEWEKALAHLEENYKLYIAGVVFVLLCMVIGALIRMSSVLNEREAMTLYAEAALVEDAAERLEKYRAVEKKAGRWTPEVLYMMGETAIEAGQYDTARETFERVVNQHADSEYALPAADGLAFLAWNRGDLEEALAGFQRIVDQSPGAFIARKKHFEIGQVLEELERYEEAGAAYRKQMEVFPDSMIAQRASQALDALRAKYPDLFPEEKAPDAAATDGGDAAGLGDAQTPYLSTEEEQPESAPETSEPEAAPETAPAPEADPAPEAAPAPETAPAPEAASAPETAPAPEAVPAPAEPAAAVN